MKDGQNIEKLTKKDIVELIIFASALMTLVVLINAFVICRVKVNGSSMCPTLKEGQSLIVEKITKNFLAFDRYDIVIVDTNRYQKTLIKRVIGLPGETVEIRDGRFYVNDILLQDTEYFNGRIEFPDSEMSPITLGEDEYFVAGDNRNNSNDSRNPEIGPIAKNEISGKVWFAIPKIFNR